MQVSTQYDYIITGAGCAGLSLAARMIQSGKFSDKKILLADADTKNKNDRTWCFWEKEEGLFETIVYKSWSKLLFHADGFSKELSIAPYQYKLIRSISFYNCCIDLIKQHSNFHFINGEVRAIESSAEKTSAVINGQEVTCQYIFNSILFEKPKLKKNEYWLLQHFKGWFIKTEEPQFNDAVATLMDFRTDQSTGAAFFYVLPFSATEALVEYTLFSKELLKDEAYEAALKMYVENDLNIRSYSVIEKEFGVIPMTNYAFSTGTNNIINIGTAGGRTKGSSGYTFQAIQKHTAALVNSLIQNGNPFGVEKLSSKFAFYDSVLLNILHNKTLDGATIFSDLFKKNEPQQVLKFLDNETSLTEDIRLISSLPVVPFTKAAARHLF